MVAMGTYIKAIRDALIVIIKQGVGSSFASTTFYGYPRSDSTFPYCVIRPIAVFPDSTIAGHTLAKYRFVFGFIVVVDNSGVATTDEDSLLDAAGEVIDKLMAVTTNLGSGNDNWQELVMDEASFEYDTASGSVDIGEARITVSIYRDL